MIGVMGDHSYEGAKKRSKYCTIAIISCLLVLGISAAVMVSQLNKGRDRDSLFPATSDKDKSTEDKKREKEIEEWLANFDWNVTISSDLLVGAYYYPWHLDDFHRGQGYLREQLQPPQQPTLGEYDDSDPRTIAQHLAWSRQANIGLWVTSWWGEGKREDTTIREAILTHPHLADHKVALFYETVNRVKESENYSTQRVRPDLEFMCREYFNHPNYLKIDGKPVLFVYLTRKLEMENALSRVVEEMRQTMQEECDKELYIVGDHTFRHPPSADEEYSPFYLMDAVTTYDVYGGMKMRDEIHAGQEAVDTYYTRQLQWKSQALAHNCSYMPAATPGYNDLGVRPEANHSPLSRRLTAEDEEGSLFRAALSKATKLVDPGAQSILMINSFNEWHEDTQIEPTSGEITDSPSNLTRQLEYEGYGETYLDILRDCTSPNATCT
mmetsp:Transcript_19502/g.55088  ORF Transcript_19502/g.55088 Transcript_19502/m.55088 type:complete len:439 (-) Transcript_19502:313-1629(-)|eukprot:CAMPEP_0119552346 /NCGR_PEP_ID=MMETSP1352-20130426/5373_1 /TAXON_ID=265584 /ORGANISM="Stauroneis constricta, Strain CCMP1120" /LENGTH=438 /DNA_ID=CAMNT_0007598577 /DNA_START=35 /DNA_END=1351 /DNA_ORIENTATION=+